MKFHQIFKNIIEQNISVFINVSPVEEDIKKVYIIKHLICKIIFFC